MNKSTTLIVTLAVIILAGLGVIYFRQTHHYVEHNAWRGLQGKAKFDGYFFADTFLQQNGYNITRKSNYAKMSREILDKSDTVFFTNDARTLREEQVATLLDWVENGGNLVLEKPQSLLEKKRKDKKLTRLFEMPKSHALLTAANISANYENTCIPTVSEMLSIGETEYLDFIDDIIKKLKARNDPMKSDAQKVDELMQADDSGNTYSIGNQSINLKFDCAPTFSGDEKSRLIYRLSATDSGDVFATFSHGKGHITIFSIPSIYFNTKNYTFLDQIWSRDNASLLLLLMQSGAPKGKNLLWYEKAVNKSVWSFLWQYFAFALITATILLVLWIWRSSRRFGSIIVEDSRKGLTLERHLRATGEFYHRNEESNAMLKHCYERLYNSISRRIGTPNNMNRDSIANKVAEKTGLEKKQILRILSRPYANNDSEFTQLVYWINEITRRL